MSIIGEKPLREATWTSTGGKIAVLSDNELYIGVYGEGEVSFSEVDVELPALGNATVTALGSDLAIVDSGSVYVLPSKLSMGRLLKRVRKTKRKRKRQADESTKEAAKETEKASTAEAKQSSTETKAVFSLTHRAVRTGAAQGTSAWTVFASVSQDGPAMRASCLIPNMREGYRR
eukprot:TRINITY_DN959_c0_g2_i13.p1 TRINITY_DN959_c0_g2~~TRINITY_DN959_c0_g2_i13.p1  ORF type:complete len:175 (+),score=15.00 TRINITY_DN959_c0_g2_i13:736-1260(+)